MSPYFHLRSLRFVQRWVKHFPPWGLYTDTNLVKYQVTAAAYLNQLVNHESGIVGGKYESAYITLRKCLRYIGYTIHHSPVEYGSKRNFFKLHVYIFHVYIFHVS